MFLGPSFNKWCIGVLRTKCGQETAQGPSLQSEDFLSQQVYAPGCLHEWMMLMWLNLLNETWFCLILCMDILSTLVCFLCCLPDFLIFCNLKCGSEHAQELGAPDAAKFARQRHTRGHRRSYGQNGPWWHLVTVHHSGVQSKRAANDWWHMFAATRYRIWLSAWETFRSTIRQKAQSPIVISMTEELKSKKHT